MSKSGKQSTPILYERTLGLAGGEYVDLLRRSTLAERRPVDDAERIARMLANSNLVVAARDAASGLLVGVARSVTDFAYCCYLSDLAVDQAYQGHGIGTELIAKTRALAGPECMCLLISAPAAVGFYQRIGMPARDRAFEFTRER